MLHRLILTNQEDGASLAFDYAIIQTATGISTTASASASASSTPSSAVAATTSDTATNSTSETSSPLAGLFNQTSSDALGGLSGSSSVQKFTKADIESYGSYAFSWNAAAYFTIIVAAIMGVLIIAGILWQTMIGMDGRRKQARKASEGESYLITTERKRPRPTTRLLDALKKGKISHPVPSDDGSFRRSSHGTLGTGETYVDSLRSGR